MKRGLLGFPLLILLTQVISAQFFSGYGGFSLAEFFNRIDPQTIILVLLFLIFFALIFYALSRIFKDPYGQPNKGIAGTIAFCISAIIIYGLYRTGFDIGNIFYDWGFSVGSLYPILSIVFLIVAGLLIWKLKVGGFLMTFGLFILLLTIFTDIFYEKGLPSIIGIVSFVVGFLLWRWRRRRYVGGGIGRGPRPPRERRPHKEPMGYGQRAKELRDKQRYLYYKGLEEQQKGQEQQQRRAQARELRRGEARERKVKERYTRRFGKRAWRKRERQGI
jgi:hypothetical protein